MYSVEKKIIAFEIGTGEKIEIEPNANLETCDEIDEEDIHKIYDWTCAREMGRIYWDCMSKKQRIDYVTNRNTILNSEFPRFDIKNPKIFEVITGNYCGILVLVSLDDLCS